MDTEPHFPLDSFDEFQVEERVFPSYKKGKEEREWNGAKKWVNNEFRIGKEVDSHHTSSTTTTHANLGDSTSPPSIAIPGSTQFRNIPIEHRGITRTQLKAIQANIERRCIKEKWKRCVWENGKRTNKYVNLTPDTVNLHDINEYIIKPFTKLTGKSFIESLPSTAGWQSPRWFVSHTWSETFYHTMTCIEQHGTDFLDNKSFHDEARGGGMTLETPIWICAFANNQNDLGADIVDDPTETGFAKAMKEAEYRTISLLDEECKIFTRIWCVLELHMTLQLPRLKRDEKTLLSKAQSSNSNATDITRELWAVYTSIHHHNNLQAVGILSDGRGTPADGGSSSKSAKREQEFPIERILNALDIDIEQAEASYEIDKIHILNFIANRGENELDLPPMKNHENYASLNADVKGAFASSLPALLGSLQKGRDEWLRMLDTMKGGSCVREMSFDFSKNSGWYEFKTKDAAEIIQHLPSSIEDLEINAYSFGGDIISDWICSSGSQLRRLSITLSLLTDEQLEGAGQRIAEAIGNSNIEHLRLRYTNLIVESNVNIWVVGLARNKKLKVLEMVETMKSDPHNCEDATKRIIGATSARAKVDIRYLFPQNRPTCTRPICEDYMSEQTVIHAVIVAGVGMIGNTSLLHRIISNTCADNYQTTIGIDFRTEMHKIGKEIIKLLLWDTAGRKSFRSISMAYIRSGRIIIYTYSVTSKESFDEVLEVAAEARKNKSIGESIFPCLVGLQIDSVDERQISTEEGFAVAHSLGMLHYECSAKTGANVHKIIPELLAMQKVKREKVEDVNNTKRDKTKKDKTCGVM